MPSTPQLYELVDPSDEGAVLAEVEHIAASLGFIEQVDSLARIHTRVKDIFQGRNPEYRASNTRYHDLEHTLSVVLATARLMHGCALAHHDCPSGPFLLGMAASYFHDTGLIQRQNETTGTGARHTVGHEERSVAVMRDVLGKMGFSPQGMEDVAAMIRCTELAGDPQDIPFRTPEQAQAGRILGTADLCAQIADRHYLEKLPDLFKEFEEAGLPGFSSELDLLLKTASFYEHVAKKRLEGPLGNQSQFMVHHFRQRWNVDHDLYAEAIARNMAHLERSLKDCGESYDCLMSLLKRRPRNGNGS